MNKNTQTFIQPTVPTEESVCLKRSTSNLPFRTEPDQGPQTKTTPSPRPLTPLVLPGIQSPQSISPLTTDLGTQFIPPLLPFRHGSSGSFTHVAFLSQTSCPFCLGLHLRPSRGFCCHPYLLHLLPPETSLETGSVTHPFLEISCGLTKFVIFLIRVLYLRISQRRK